MNKPFPDKNLAVINFSIVFYFILMWLSYYYKIDFVLLGVFRELLTIPFLLAQLVFLIIGIPYLFSRPRNPWTMVSILALVICAVLTIGSFF